MSLDSNVAQPKYADAWSSVGAGTDILASDRMVNVQPEKNVGQGDDSSDSTSIHGEQSAHQFLPQVRVTESGIDFSTNGPSDTQATPGTPGNGNPSQTNAPIDTPSTPGTPGSGTPSQENASNDIPSEPESPPPDFTPENGEPGNVDNSTPGSPARDIMPENVVQGQIGNCFFEASLASLANTSHGKEVIANMVKNNQDGSTTVTFPGDTSHPVTITQQDVDKAVKDGNVYDYSSALTAVQTAFLKYDRIGDYGRGVNALQYSEVPYLAQIKTPTDALHLLTGERTACELDGFNSDFNVGSVSPENLSRFIKQAFDNGQPVVAGTSPFADSPIVSTHVYSVLGFDPSTGTVTVRNPWGDNPDLKKDETKNGITDIGDGKMTMNFETFRKNFSKFSAAGVNPTETRLNDLFSDASSTAGSIGDTLYDVVHGRFGNALDDGASVLKDTSQLLIDGLSSTVNEAESVVGARIRGIYDVVSRPLHGDLPSLEDVNNATGVTQPVVDAGCTVINKVTSTVSNLFDDLF